MSPVQEQPNGTGQQIAFGRSDWASMHEGSIIRGLIERHAATRICDVGGGANPCLPADYILRRGLQYTLLDVSPEELARAPEGYRTMVADICSADLQVTDRFDFVTSRFVAEHVRDAEMFHRNVHRLLHPGGVAFHFFPTLFAPPFVLNLLLPEVLSGALKRVFSLKEWSGEIDKFPAHYRWCRGPGRRRIGRFERLGYRVLEYHGFFGHPYYQKHPVLQRPHEWLTNLLVRHPVSALTSYAYLVLQKNLAPR